MNTLVLVKIDDDLWELTYRGDVMGWIQKVQPEGRRVEVYQSETPRGEIRHAYSLNQARAALAELYC
jgi:hypothetical protein